MDPSGQNRGRSRPASARSGPGKARAARRPALALALAALLALAGCGDDETDEPAAGGEASPPGEASDPGAAEASPEAPPASSPGSGETDSLASGDEEAVEAAVRAYVDALNAHDGAAVCELLVPAAVKPGELPRKGGDCAAALDSSIGVRPPRGGPAWRGTKVGEITAVSVGEARARATVTVTHRFADRSFTSIEEDVIYLDRRDEGWLIAKPSATFYRAVGYPEPPLRSLTPP